MISWHVVLHNNPRGVHFFSADGANNSARNSRLAKYYTNQPSILPRQARDKRKETINSIETQNAGLEWELQQKLDAKGNPQPPHFFDEHIHQIDGSVATVQRHERCENQRLLCDAIFILDRIFAKTGSGQTSAKTHTQMTHKTGRVQHTL